MNVNGQLRRTIVVVHHHAGVLELIEQALRGRGARVLTTRDPGEALEIARQLKIDLLVVAHAQHDLGRDLRTFQPELEVLRLDQGPMLLAEVEAAALEKLSGRQQQG